MIGSLSSFIELFAAIYLTITLDDLLLKRFWTPDYALEMEKAISGIKLPTIAKNDVLKMSKSVLQDEDKRSRRRGGIMFYSAVLMLILIGFESGTEEFSNIEVVTLILYSLFISIVYIFDEVFLKSTSRVIISIMASTILAISSGVSVVCCDKLVTVLIIVPKIRNVVKFIIVAFLVLPVLWQLLRNRIYTRFYLSYIVYIIDKKAREYKYAVEYNKSKGSQMSLVAQPYMDVVADNIAASDRDRTITPFFNILKAQLLSVDYSPNIPNLIKSSILIHRRYYPSKRTLDRLCKKYNTLSNTSIKDFCEKHNVDINVFKKHRNQKFS
ncbi:MAG: hypothetical protein IKL83_06405 [Muribaculaceae bacterium]|nr:hypothetical protein [Muribaculaceae bacterium]